MGNQSNTDRAQIAALAEQPAPAAGMIERRGAK